MPSSTTRGFDPSRVQRKHISPVTFVYGDDVPGISARCNRFIEVLKDNNEDPSVYNTMQEAIGYIESGDMFTDTVTIVVRDMSDALKTSSSRLFSRLINSLVNYDDDSTFVLCAVTSKSTSTLNRFISFVDKIGGTSRNVSAPNGYEMRRWIAEYGKTKNKPLTSDQADKIALACKNDIDLAGRVVDYLYQDINDFSVSDLEYWLETQDDITVFALSDMMRSGDIKSIAESIKRFKNYTDFLLSARTAVDILLKSNVRSSTDDSRRKLLAMHRAVTKALECETGSTRKVSNEKQFLSELKLAFDGYE